MSVKNSEKKIRERRKGFMKKEIKRKETGNDKNETKSKGVERKEMTLYGKSLNRRKRARARLKKRVFCRKKGKERKKRQRGLI